MRRSDPTPSPTNTPPAGGFRPLFMSVFSLAVSLAVLGASIYFVIAFALHPHPLFGGPAGARSEATILDKAIGFGIGFILIVGSLRWVAAFWRYSLLSSRAYFKKTR